MKKFQSSDRSFIRALNQNMLLVAQQSFHTMFFMKQLWQELYIDVDIVGMAGQNLFPDHELYVPSFDDLKKEMFPWNYNSFDYVIGDGELDRLSEWLSDGRELSLFFKKQRENNFKKTSFILKKTYIMAKDFSLCLHKIADEYSIPFVSLYELTRFITSGCDTEKMIDCREMIETSLIPAIFLPKELSGNKKASIISEVLGKIHHLIKESFWVLLILDWIDYCKAKKIIEDDVKSIKMTKEVLINQVPFQYLTDAIQESDSKERLIEEYFNYQHAASKKFQPVMVQFIDANLSMSLKNKIFILESAVGYKTESQEIPSILVTITPAVASKIDIGLLMTYNLSGDVLKILSYLKAILQNIVISELHKFTDAHFNSTLGISLKTAKLYAREINEGKIELGRDFQTPCSIYGLTPEIVEIISTKKKKSQKHELEGHLTQNALIKFLLNTEVQKKLYQQGCPLQDYKFKRTTLKKAIQDLKKRDAIPYIVNGIAHQYRNEDIPQIAKALIKYFEIKKK